MDFYQHGITTLHRFSTERPAEDTTALMEEYCQKRPIALVLPMVYDELDRPAMLGIRQGLQKTAFLNEIVIALTAQDQKQVARVRDFFEDLPVDTRVMWCESPEVTGVVDRLSQRGFDLAGFKGKGLAVWLGLGVAAEANHAVVLHDADIEQYDPEIVTRLAFPLVSPGMDFYFAKGYYARLSGSRMYGRVTRLFLWPLVDALAAMLAAPSPLLAYLRRFRYPLSGEMALTADLARNVRMPTDWGLELGLLGEVYRNASAKRICQVDLGEYSHKHNPIGKDATEGLQRMALDLATTLFRLLASLEGVRITKDLLVTLRVGYRRECQDAIRKYNADSFASGLAYDRHAEESLVETFEGLIEPAGEQFARKPTSDQIGEWLRAMTADPDAAAALRWEAAKGAAPPASVAQ